ncbi:hypothetical protein J5N97_027125 [Dioscorea zingiberensis]|uniref:Plastocyanin-like domain-containing protein n=1 Tax=Dioscorea zingiberensis TaxID=325984 RepID=A0A9D5H7G9_9LILI|nr:hypothetical protein J5N97_027125 [Dioscorea zingiberensis]
MVGQMGRHTSPSALFRTATATATTSTSQTLTRWRWNGERPTSSVSSTLHSNDELFFAIAGHNMTVVEIDAVYCKPFTTDALLIAPGQTTNVIVRANRAPGRYFMATRPFMDRPVPVDNKTATAILQYKGVPTTILPLLPGFPPRTTPASPGAYLDKLRSLNTPQFPANVPLHRRPPALHHRAGHEPLRELCEWHQAHRIAEQHHLRDAYDRLASSSLLLLASRGFPDLDFPDKPVTAFNYSRERR